MAILIFLLISYVLICVTLAPLFEKAGVDRKKAWIPGVNFGEWAKLIGRRPSYAWWLLFPLVNLFIFAGMAVDLVRSFGMLRFKHTAAAVVYAPAIFYAIGKDSNRKYEGPILTREADYARQIKEAVEKQDSYQYKKLTDNNPFKKSAPREWFESIFFAVFAAALIRMFLIEAYVIPTPSMEGSLNVGDFLFVSKAHYGIRTPSTIAMVPLLHNRLPFFNAESYLEKPSIKSYRLPALEKIEVGKPIVFNWPVGDSIYLTARRSYSVAQIKQEPGHVQDDPQLAAEIRKNNIITRPVDKRDHYIKRCVGTAGDTVQIINRQVYINGRPMENPEHMQFLYAVRIPNPGALNLKKLEEWGIDYGDSGTRQFLATDLQGFTYLHLEPRQAEQLKSLDPAIQVEIYKHSSAPLKTFPNDSTHFKTWTVDDFGPIWIPKKGASVRLTMANIALYSRIINVYENNDFEIKGGQIYINGQPSDSYTFKQDYYWAMGDNRHNSEDSRMWGFVPGDHIVGKPLFIWFSTKEGNMSNGINWDRIFKSATSKK